MASLKPIASTIVALIAATALSAQAPAPVTAPAARGGYLAPGEMPDSLLLDPPPPAPGSAAEASDVEASRQGLKQRGNARWQLATRDAELVSPAATSAFSCAAGIAIGPTTTPLLNALMQRTLRDFALSTAATKSRYMRPRPFMVNGQPICTPAAEAVLRSNGSYPSGHSALGYGWGLVLAEVMPERAAALIARGMAFGDSRRICNVHWESDIEEGRVPAAAVFTVLNSKPAFRADVDAARAEVLAARATASPPDCALEHEALGRP